MLHRNNKSKPVNKIREPLVGKGEVDFTKIGCAKKGPSVLEHEGSFSRGIGKRIKGMTGVPFHVFLIRPMTDTLPQVK